MNRKHLFEAL